MALDLSFKQLIDAAEDGAATTAQPICIAVDRIDEDPDQPRRSFDEQKLEELAESVRQHGDRGKVPQLFGRSERAHEPVTDDQGASPRSHWLSFG
ncbi:hypothetical protein ACVWZV_009292 [Bradyrhizobium sp. GM5.1]|uniref:ParB N-terminal domain-containing protein n=1 Tax=Bradyrhizobium sp. 156 TaxID=2782630 RepID=UPI001FF8F2FD|nr:hypothetical protein [Bradyrhizobium sp. 156]